MSRQSVRRIGRRDYNRKGYPVGQKEMWGASVPIPEPQQDWDEIRAIKLRCAGKCAKFDDVSGGCRSRILPRNRKCGFEPIIKPPEREVDTEILELMQPLRPPKGIKGVKIA